MCQTKSRFTKTHIYGNIIRNSFVFVYNIVFQIEEGKSVNLKWEMTYPPCNLLIPDWYRGSILGDTDSLSDRFIKKSEFLSIEKVNQTHAGSYFVTMENVIGIGKVA